MWGFGGRYYWGRKERGKVEGIIVVFACNSKHSKDYVDLYSSLGWNSLVCHSQFLNLYFPDKAASLAQEIVHELVQELKIMPRPVVLASFSGGSKACMYKVLQIIEGKGEEQQLNVGDYQLVRDCVCGHIFDSTPVDLVKFLKMSRPPFVPLWIASGISSTLDAFFLSRIESQCAEYWQTLYSAVSIGAPYLILCSENDDLAPFQIICNFAGRLKELGADVKLVKWSNSSHLGHFQHHPEEYRASVTELLRKAAVIYSQRIRKLEGEKMGMEGPHDEISNPFCNLKEAAAKSIQNLHRVDLHLNDHFYVPTSSLEYHEDRDLGPLQDEHNDRYIPLSGQPKISAHGVLGQILFDSCVPEDVEDWDLRSLPSMRRRHSHFNPMKCIRRARL